MKLISTIINGHATIRCTRLLILLILFSGNQTLLASESDVLYKKSLSFYDINQFDSALHYAKNAGNLFAQSGEWDRLITCQNHLALCLQQTDQLERAVTILTYNLDLAIKHLGEYNSQTALTAAYLSVGYVKIGLIDSASHFSDLAITIAESQSFPNNLDLVNLYYLAAEAPITSSETIKAEGYIKKGLSISSKFNENTASNLPELYNSLGRIYHKSYKYGMAMDQYERAYQISNESNENMRASQARYLSNIGLTQINLGNLEESERVLRQSLALQLAVYDSASLAVLNTISSLGRVYFYQKHANEAILHFEISLKEFEKKLRPDHPKIAEVLTMLGRSHQNRREYRIAEGYLKRALKITKTAFGTSNRLATATADLGDVYYLLEEDDRCRELYNEALRIANSLVPVNKFVIAYINESLAVLEKVTGNTEEAIRFQKQNAQIYTELWGINSKELAIVYRSLSMLYYGNKNYVQALEYSHKALQTIVEGFDEGIHENPDLDSNYENNAITLKILRYKAKSMHHLYQSNNDVRFLRSSLKTCVLALDLIDHMRAHSVDETSKAFLDEQVDELVDLGIQNGVKFLETIEDRKIREELFLLVERVNCSVLRLLVEDSKAKVFSNIPDSLLRKESDLKERIAVLQKKVAVDRDSVLLQKLKSELLFTTQALETLIDHLENSYPKYYQFKYNTELIAVSKIEEQLSPNENIIEYKLTDKVLYVFLLNSSGIHIDNVPIEVEQFKALISTFTKSILQRKQEEYKQSAKKLYDILIDPIKSKIVGDHLTVIPDDNIWEINFDLLLESNSPSSHYSDYSYLLKNYAISYAYSMNLIYNDSFKNSDIKVNKEVLAFSYSDKSNGEIALRSLRSTNLSKLPGAAREVKMVSEIYNGKYYYGDAASEETFKRNASQYAILHLAVHGEVDLKSPSNSKLRFKSETDTSEDGKLHAYELYNMKLNADLAVLSACNTGTGQLVNGEGLMSMGRAFTYGGVNCLALTLWEIPDDSSPEIMNVFYKGLKEGYSKSESLRRAKLTYLESSDPSRSSPYYWGGFVLVGSDDPIRESANYLIYFVMVGILILVGGAFYQSKQK